MKPIERSLAGADASKKANEKRGQKPRLKTPEERKGESNVLFLERFEWITGRKSKEY